MKISRKYEYRRNLPHYQKDERAHFITFTTCKRWILPPEARDLVLRHCLQENGRKFQAHTVVIMPDHVHMIFTPLRDSSTQPYTLAEIVGPIKGASAHSINRLLHRKGSVWLDESFDHVLRSEERVQDRIEYLRQNPVRKGLVRSPEEYRWLWTEAQPRAAVPHMHEPTAETSGGP